MQAKEFGKEHDLKIVLIPGNMMSWRQFKNVIPILEKDFHVIAVSTDGYDEKTEYCKSRIIKIKNRLFHREVFEID